ncbi:hypothetical protein J0J30_22975, partial [Vibrio vulnificus]|nr:hypothetical protein [Vibrio vulnificus]
MDFTFNYASGSRVNRNRTLDFSDGNKKTSPYMGFSEYFLLKYSYAFSTHLSIQQVNSSSIFQYVWSWAINNDFSLEFGYLIDPLTSILLILI